uniref:TBC1 domain family member 13-like n=2 Tax=Hirondellea gigas TaxID=1518452 RepID=A0A2P2I233_9CRUS
MAYKARLAEFDSVLQENKIDLNKLRKLCFTGVPDEGGRRAVCWCLLLHYLPADTAAWSLHLAKKRAQYQAFVDDIVGISSSLSNSSSSASLNNSNKRTGRSCDETLTNGLNNLSIHSGNTSINDTGSPITPPKDDFGVPTQCLNNSRSKHADSGSRDGDSSRLSRRGGDDNDIVLPLNDSVRTNNRLNDSGISSNTFNSNSTCNDHPLNLSPDSEWGEFFKDNEILGQIDKDVRRLCPDMCFFQRATAHPHCNNPRLSSRVTYTPLHSDTANARFCQSVKRSRPRRAPSPPPVVLAPGEEAHWEVLERVLFVYAKLNPGQGYVQGMNEIIGPIYYVLATSPEHAEHAEADCFWLFTALMAEVRDLFIRTLDDSESGIGRLMGRLMDTLAVHDRVTAGKLNQQGIREQYFAFRWLSLLFSQEFALPDVIRVWDSVLSRTDTHAFLVHFATAMIIMQRDTILSGDFAANMKLLQNYPPCDVLQILNKAVHLSTGADGGW